MTYQYNGSSVVITLSLYIKQYRYIYNTSTKKLNVFCGAMQTETNVCAILVTKSRV
jgi:hypothetical protein